MPNEEMEKLVSFLNEQIHQAQDDIEKTVQERKELNEAGIQILVGERIGYKNGLTRMKNVFTQMLDMIPAGQQVM